MASVSAYVSFVQEAFCKLSIDSNHLVELKREQEQALNCLLEGRDVFTVIPTGYGKSFIFQLFAMAMKDKKDCEGLQSDTVVLLICPLTSIIQDQAKEGNLLGWTVLLFVI